MPYPPGRECASPPWTTSLCAPPDGPNVAGGHRSSPTIGWYRTFLCVTLAVFALAMESSSVLASEDSLFRRIPTRLTPSFAVPTGRHSLAAKTDLCVLRSGHSGQVPSVGTEEDGENFDDDDDLFRPFATVIACHVTPVVPGTPLAQRPDRGASSRFFVTLRLRC